MKCPLIGVANPAEWRRESPTEADCLKEECAWWSEEHNQCDPTGLLPWLIHIESSISEIASKIPLGILR